MEVGTNSVIPVNRALPFIAMAVLVSPAAPGEGRAFNPSHLAPGTIIRIAARKPLINLGRAEVVQCTSNMITVRHREDMFQVRAADIFELALLEAVPAAATNRTSVADGLQPARSVSPRGEGARPSPESPERGMSLWGRVKGLWQRFSPWAKTEAPPPSRPPAQPEGSRGGK